MKPNVLLVVLPYVIKHIDANRPKVRSFFAFPFGLLSIATYCKDLAKIRLCDYGNMEYEEARNRLEAELEFFHPEIVGFSMGYDNSYPCLSGLAGIVKNFDSKILVVLGGSAASYSYQEIIEEQGNNIDAVCFGEGEEAFYDLLTRREFKNPWITRGNISTPPTPRFIQDLDTVIDIDYSFVDHTAYEMAEAFSPYARDKRKCFFLMTSRGCFGKCLTGDTVIHTINGDFPIKELVGKEEIKVLTRHPITQEPLYADAIHIRKTQEMAEIVRVNFDDGTHIDCTPDHKFKVFSYKNQFNPEETETDVEAQYLKPKQQVRAVRFDPNKGGRLVVSTRRNINRQRTTVVMESLMGRKLLPNERVHHKDRNPGNDVPRNLALTTKNRHIPDWHPEIAERMRKNNPAKNMTPEWREKLRLSTIGKKRSLEQRLRYRESKMGDKNPRYKKEASHRYPHPSRIKELGDVNHKVVSVERLPYKEDVYCMEVPAIHWFYANKVLVHNCSFCSNSAIHGKKVRQASVDAIISHVERLVRDYGMETLIIYDDCLLYNKKRAKELFKRLALLKVRIECPNGLNVAFIDEELACLMKAAGMDTVYLAIESGSEYVLKKLIRKPLKLSQVKPAIDALRKSGLYIHGFLVMGMPGEELKHRQETVDFLETIDLDWCGFNFATPVKGSKLYEDCMQRGWIKKKGIQDTVDKEYIINVPGVDKTEIIEHVEWMNRHFNFYNNRRMRIGDYEIASKAFRQVIARYGRHELAKRYLKICEQKAGIRG